MPNSRKTTKRHRGAWLEPEVIDSLRRIAAEYGTDFTGLLEKIGRGEVKVEKKEGNDDEVR